MTTAHNKKQLDRLKGLLKELFQLDKPELDFGLYKIMHAKSAQITQFLENDLLKEIEAAFGAESEVRVQQAQLKVAEAIDQAKSFGAPDPEATPAVTQARAAYKLALEGGNTQAEIYDHLYRFFERYYDNGDFLSKRYYARENDSRAAPYSVPYDGREVYLHWANKDQYYIKSSEYLSNFSFDLNEAARLNSQSQPSLDLESPSKLDDSALKVHMHLAQAQEGEHGNIKAARDQKREFIPLLSNPVAFNALGELVLLFEYRVLPEGYPIDSDTEAALKTTYDFRNKGDLPAHWMASVFLKALRQVGPEGNKRYADLLAQAVPTETQKKRPLLAKYIQQYTARNTMDYFIHKDLGGFLRRELDFYIKNELMRLDDIESAEAPRVEDYLRKIKALRRIAHQLIAFLAQLEDFQKKLWLKKKFVTETQYCITLDRVPESLYPEIADNDAQREEWVKLFAIDEIVGDATQLGYSVPLTVEFLKWNRFLLIDTSLFDEDFKNTLISSIEDFDSKCNGIMINSDNFQVINLMNIKYKSSVSCVYIDPPYNAKTSEILYKNSYKNSSWLTMIYDRMALLKPVLTDVNSIAVAIDENEQENLGLLLSEKFQTHRKHCISLVHNKKGIQGSDFSYCHEFVYFMMSEKHPGTKDKIIPEKNWEWANLRKWGSDSTRDTAANCFYPITIKDLKIIDFGTVSESEFHPPANVINADGSITIYPVDAGGIERKWRYEYRTVASIKEYLKVIQTRDGEYQIHKAKNSQQFKTIWDDNLYIAGDYGTKTVSDMGLYPPNLFPKSIYSVYDALYALSQPNDLILDYFGGSGTTAHAVIKLNSDQNSERKYFLAEQNIYFDTVLLPRVKKCIYTNDWKDGKPVNRDGTSHCFKYLRLESYEDTLNNLSLQSDPARERALGDNPSLREDYVLNYWLDVETQGSQSLLNVANFRDPTAYTMRIKQPGSDMQLLQHIDLIETFNWLIGLWVEHMAAPQTFEAEFARETDPLLPKDQNTRLVCKRTKPVDAGPYWFRLVEGYTLKVPGDDTSRQKTLVVWRKLTDNPEQDNAVLQHFLMEKLAISPREQTYAVIYVNGSHTLPNPVVEGEQTKVRLIEEAFHQAMWSQDGA